MSSRGELLRFLVSGFSAVGVDCGSYFLLLGRLGPSCAKTISFILGSILAFLLNKFWTFKKPERSWREVLGFGALYTSTLGANVLVNKVTLLISGDFVFFAFLTATGTSTILNYLGQKFWVFRKDSGQR